MLPRTQGHIQNVVLVEKGENTSAFCPARRSTHIPDTTRAHMNRFLCSNPLNRCSGAHMRAFISPDAVFRRARPNLRYGETNFLSFKNRPSNDWQMLEQRYERQLPNFSVLCVNARGCQGPIGYFTEYALRLVVKIIFYGFSNEEKKRINVSSPRLWFSSREPYTCALRKPPHEIIFSPSFHTI